MDAKQRSSLNIAVKELAEQVAAACSLPVEVASTGDVIECRLLGPGREIFLITENDEITLVFGHSHLHAYKFYEEDLLEAVAQIRQTLLAIIRGETVSYQVSSEQEPLGGGFCSAHDIGLVGNKEWWKSRWRRIDVMGWDPQLDQTFERSPEA